MKKAVKKNGKEKSSFEKEFSNLFRKRRKIDLSLITDLSASDREQAISPADEIRELIKLPGDVLANECHKFLFILMVGFMALHLKQLGERATKSEFDYWFKSNIFDPTWNAALNVKIKIEDTGEIITLRSGKLGPK